MTIVFERTALALKYPNAPLLKLLNGFAGDAADKPPPPLN